MQNIWWYYKFLLILHTNSNVDIKYIYHIQIKIYQLPNKTKATTNK